MSGLCLGVSEWDLRVCGDVLIPNLLAQIHIYVIVSSDIAFSSSALPYMRKHLYLGVSGWCLGSLDCVWIISKGVWQMSGGVKVSYKLKTVQ